MKSNPLRRRRARPARPPRPSRPPSNAASTHRRSREIIEAAARVFAELGYYGATTQKIADVLGMRQASLYYYLPSKEAALEQVCEEGVAGYVETAKAIAAGPGTAAERLAALIRAHIAPNVGRSDFVRVFLTQRQFLPAREPEADWALVPNAGAHHRGCDQGGDRSARVSQGRRSAPCDARDPWNVQRCRRLVPQGKRLDRTDRSPIRYAGGAGACSAGQWAGWAKSTRPRQFQLTYRILRPAR